MRAAYHFAIGMRESCFPKAAEMLDLAEPDALTHLEFPPAHWKRLRTNNVQDGANREIKCRSRVWCKSSCPSGR